MKNMFRSCHVILVLLVTWFSLVRGDIRLSDSKHNIDKIRKFELFLEKSAQNLKLRKYHASIEDAKQALLLDPGNVQGMYLIGVSQWQWGNRSIANQVLKKAIVLDPDYLPIRRDYARLQSELYDVGMTRIEDVIQVYSDMIERYTSSSYSKNSEELLVNNKQLSVKRKVAHVPKTSSTVAQDTNAVMWGLLELGNIYQYKLRLLQDALESYYKPMQLSQWTHVTNVDLKASLYFHIGNAYSSLGHYHESISSYKFAVKLKPDMFAAWSNLGNNYRSVGLFRESYNALSQAYKLEPSSGAVLNNLGVTAKAMGNVQEALELFQAAIEVWPGCIEAMASLADYSQDNGNETQATKYYLDAIQEAIAQNRVEIAAATTVKAALALPRISASVKHSNEMQQQYLSNLDTLHRVYQRSSTTNHESICFNRNRTFSELSVEGNCVENSLKVLIVPIKYIRSAVSDLGYYYMYFGKDNKRPRELFVELLQSINPQLKQLQSNQPTGNFNPDFLSENCKHAQKGENLVEQINNQNSPATIRIGFISEFFREHSVAKLVGPIIEALGQHDKYTIVLILVPASISGQVEEDETTQRLCSSVHEVLRLPVPYSTESAASNLVRAAALDLLIFAEVGMGLNGYILALERLAPIQLAFWGHGITTGMKTTMDIFVVPKWFLLDNLLGEEEKPKFTEHLWQMSGLTTVLAPPPNPSHNRFESRKQLIPKAYQKRNLYLCAQTLYKIHPEMDNVFAKILLRDPSASIVIISGAQSTWAEMLLERIYSSVIVEGSIGNSIVARMKRAVLVLQPMNRQHYVELLTAVDVVLDTWPCSGGVSHLEALSVGAPVVAKRGSPHQLAISSGIYMYMGLTNMLVTTNDEYVDMAVQIATNVTLYNQLSQTIQKAVGESKLYGESFAYNPTENSGNVWDLQLDLSGNHQKSAPQRMLEDWMSMITCLVNSLLHTT